MTDTPKTPATPEQHWAVTYLDPEGKRLTYGTWPKQSDAKLATMARGFPFEGQGVRIEPVMLQVSPEGYVSAPPSPPAEEPACKCAVLARQMADQVSIRPKITAFDALVQLAEYIEGKAEPPPAADPPRDRHGHLIEPCDGCGKLPCVCPDDCKCPDCGYGLLGSESPNWNPAKALIERGGVRINDPRRKADESGATREPPPYDPKFGNGKRCERLGCGHEYRRHFDTYEEMRPVGCKYCDCEIFVPQPGIEPGRGEVSEGGRPCVFDQLAAGLCSTHQAWKPGRCSKALASDTEAKLHAAGERLAEERACHDCREYRAMVARELDRLATRARLAEQERDDARDAGRQYIAETDPLLCCDADNPTCGECRRCYWEKIDGLERESRVVEAEVERLQGERDEARAERNQEALDHRNTVRAAMQTRERLQGEIAGLAKERDARKGDADSIYETLKALLEDRPDKQTGRYVHLLICNGSRAKPIGAPGVICNCPLGVRIKRAALAPQEGAEKGTKG